LAVTTTTQTDLRELAATSVELIATHQQPSGSYPAGPAYPVYRYCWLRDGTFIADAMSRAGRGDSAEAFFTWCAGVLTGRAEHIGDIVGRAARGEPVPMPELLPTRYAMDGSLSTEPWTDFQTDGYGSWIWALVAHAARHGRDLAPYREAVGLSVDYLCAFGTLPCYDWWEERTEYRHVSTLGSIRAGVAAALGAGLLDEARVDRARGLLDEVDRLVGADAAAAGHLTKWLGSGAVDGSLLACLVPFEIVDPLGQVGTATAARIRHDLLGPTGGVRRYLGDTFYGGGEWINLTAWLGWYELTAGDRDAALSRLSWIAGQASVGLLPEQVDAAPQEPAKVAEWESLWGPVATPLLWSHAMYLTLAVECGVYPG
jgi:GH15 family glucan-1,4-alpha-glucosidase